MKILFVYTIGKNKYGGGERWVVDAAAGLKQKGHEVFVGSKRGSKLLEKAAEQNVNTVAFNIVSDLSIYMAAKIASFIKRNKIDVVICKRRDLIVTGMAAKMSANPVVLVRSGSPPQDNLKNNTYLIKKLVDGIITNTETIKNSYINKGLNEKSFIKIIYNGLNVDDIIPAYNYSEKYPGKKIILSVGRLASEKGYNYLIDAAALLRRTRDDIVFYIIGDGKLKKELVNYAKERQVDDLFYFAGYCEPTAPYYKGCHIFLLPSLYEGMPNAAMEAMAYGKPVIMTNVNGASELSDNGNHAILISPKNPTEIAGAINEILNNYNYYCKFGEKAKYYVRKKFRTDTMIDSIENFILERRAKKYKKGF